MRVLLCAAMAATLLTAGTAAGQESGDDNKLYKWVDENGNVTYQDRPPPDESGPVQTFEQSLEAAADAEPAGDPALPDVDLTLYSIQACDACDLVRRLLSERGLPFTEKDAEQSIEVQDELREVAGVLSVPVLVIGDEVLTGYNKGLILNELDEAGFPSRRASAQGSDQGSGESAAQAAGSGSGPLTEEEIEAAARQTAPADDDAGFSEEDIFSDAAGPSADGDVTQWEEIPDDERIDVEQ